MLTFLDLQNEVLNYIDEGDDAATGTTRTLVKEALNRSHRTILAGRTWPFMGWPSAVTFATVAGTRTYALKHGVSKILTLWDSEMNVSTPLISRRDWDVLAVDRTGQQHVPLGAIYGDVWPVAAQPSSEVVTATSSTDADAAKTLILSGLNTSGDLTSETLTLADVGSTASATSSTSWSHLFAVSKGSAWTGTLTLSGATAGTLLTLTSSEYGKQYPTVEFIETPNGARNYIYTAQRTPAKLTNNYDIPDTPYPYSMVHVYDALLDLTGYNVELGSKEQRLWKGRYDDLMHGLIGSVDESIAGSRPRFVRDLSKGDAPRIHITA